MKQVVVYLHGMGGSAAEAEHYVSSFPDAQVVGFDYRSQTPWEAIEEFPAFFAQFAGCEITVIANSLGAYLLLNACQNADFKQAFLISPVVDMEQMILNLCAFAGVTQERLQQEREVVTDFGQTLSWQYLCYVREHPIVWTIPTDILYGEKDHLTDIQTMQRFAHAVGASLRVMPGGEHWFHTPEQMTFLDQWITELR